MSGEQEWKAELIYKVLDRIAIALERIGAGLGSFKLKEILESPNDPDFAEVEDNSVERDDRIADANQEILDRSAEVQTEPKDHEVDVPSKHEVEPVEAVEPEGKKLDMPMVETEEATKVAASGAKDPLVQHREAVDPVHSSPFYEPPTIKAPKFDIEYPPWPKGADQACTHCGSRKIDKTYTSADNKWVGSCPSCGATWEYRESK